ncbi:hypothetical protein ACFXTN_021896 [Malus domestica]
MGKMNSSVSFKHYILNKLHQALHFLN